MDKIPTKQAGDRLHDTAKASLNLIPMVGGALASVFETVFSSPIDRRKEEWLKCLAETVDELCEKIDGLTPEKLSNDEEFISIYLQASNIAIRTHNEEKLVALNAAVRNSVLDKSLTESKKMIFLRVIDQMTPLHIKLLDFHTYPEKYIKELNARQRPNQHTHWGDLRNVWDKLYKDTNSNNPMIDIVVLDLKNWGLVYVSQFHEATLNSVGTNFGKEFIHFINTET